MTDVPNLSTYQRWDGVCPGDHQYSTLQNLDLNPNDRNHVLFRRVAHMLINFWEGDQFAGVLIHGETGTGKSHAAIGLARALHDSGAEVAYRYMPELSTHESGVAYWTAPRIEDSIYSSGGTSVSVSTVKREGDTETTTTRSKIDREDVVLVKRDPHSVFPSYYGPGIERNPKMVLVLDDYKPQWRAHARSAVEAASNAGGLIIMTSNFGNIFDLSAPGERDLASPRPEYGDSEESKAAKAADLRREAETLTGAFLSRLAAGFVEIHFTGADRRKTTSFWANLLDPRDFS